MNTYVKINTPQKAEIPEDFVQCKTPYTRYYIRKDGQEIFDSHRNKIINKHKAPDGYVMFNSMVQNNGKVTVPRMHRIIAINLIPVPERLKNIPIEQLQINHIDENASNNAIENLEWCTNSENKAHGDYHVRSCRNIHLKRKVLQYNAKTMELVGEYNSTHKLESSGFDSSGISRCCNGIYKQYKGYIFRYGSVIEKTKNEKY